MLESDITAVNKYLTIQNSSAKHTRLFLHVLEFDSVPAFARKKVEFAKLEGIDALPIHVRVNSTHMQFYNLSHFHSTF